MTKTVRERLLERGNDDLLDGCEDKTSRGMLDLEVADEIERLRAALIEIQRQTYGSRWEAAVTAHAIATQALDGAVTAKLAVERIAQELATRSADEPESKS